MSSDRSLLVVGGGPAGVTAALQACELGARVTLLEAGQVGGTSLNRGPAPVRTLARAARLARDWSSWATFGLDGPPPVPHLPAVVANSDRVARYAHDKKDMAGHLRRHGIDLVEDLGPVGFVDPHTLAAGGGLTWSADRIILAVGGHAGRLQIPGADLALTYEDIPSLASLPRRVAVVGGADTGCQIASIFADLGAIVSLFEAGPVLVPAADGSVSAELIRAFRARNLHTHTDTLVEALSADGGAIRVDYHSGPAPAHLVADAVFFAVGWPASLSHLDLAAAGVQATPGAIPVDDCLRTNVEHVFAAGDVNGRSMGVQTA
ncbi:MAG: FAD-dependent oxidoreductase, partial [Streptosporangiaceae bacterium]